MKFKEWIILNENEHKMLRANQVILNRDMLIGAYRDYVNGQLSKSNGFPQVIRAPQAKKYFLWDGYHRLMDILIRGVMDLNSLNYTIDPGIIGNDDIRMGKQFRFFLKPGWPFGGLENIIDPKELKQQRLKVFGITNP